MTHQHYKEILQFFNKI